MWTVEMPFEKGDAVRQTGEGRGSLLSHLYVNDKQRLVKDELMKPRV